jgi:ferredoxin
MIHKYLKNVTTLTYDSDKCTGCGKCTEVCPHNVFTVPQSNYSSSNNSASNSLSNNPSSNNSANNNSANNNSANNNSANNNSKSNLSEKKARFNNKDLCMECGACALNCSSQALEVNAGVGCALAIIMGWITGKEPHCGSSEDASAGCC